jgi:FtsZ-binding cell division protein ZapB
MGIVGQGYDGSAWQSAASINVATDAAPGATDMPGRITFSTTPDGSATLAERMRITNAGLVGIGTTPGSSNKLHVLSTGGAGVTIMAEDTTSPAIGLRRDGTNEWYMVATPTGTNNLEYRNGGVAGVVRMTVGGTGNLGIGTSSTTYSLSLGPDAARTIGLERTTAGTTGYDLTISAGAAKAATSNLGGGDLILSSGTSTGSASSGMNFMTATGGSSGTSDNAPTTKMKLNGAGTIILGAGDNSATPGNATIRAAGGSGTNIAGGNLTLVAGLATGNASTGDIQFQGAPVGSTGTTTQTATTYMTVRGGGANAGNIGIGTSTPNSSLSFGGEVARTISMERTTAGTNGYDMNITAGAAKSATSNLNGGNLVLSSGISTGSASSNIMFKTATPGASATTDRTPDIKMVITGAGYVGIANTSPSYELDVTGSVRATAYLYTSDKRLKDDIQTVGGLDLISKLRGVSFVWKDSGKKAVGVIAQEVETVFPTAVRTDDKGFKAVDYPQLIGPIIEAIKDLKVMVEEVSAKVAELFDIVGALKAENTALRGEVDALKAQNTNILQRLDALEAK